MDSTLLLPSPKTDMPPGRSTTGMRTAYSSFLPINGAVGKQLPHSNPAEPAQDNTDNPNNQTAKTEVSESTGTAEAAELPRAVRSTRRRSGIPPLYTLAAVIGLAAGIFAATSLPAGADLSGNILCRSGGFLEILLSKLAWGGAFLLAEYLCGYFALGNLLVWLAPLLCGLGTGAALGAAFLLNGMDALWLVPGCAVCAAVVIFAARASADMSAQLLRLISTNKNSIVSTSPAAGEYTLRFLVCLAILSAYAIAGAALRMSVISA